MTLAPVKTYNQAGTLRAEYIFRMEDGNEKRFSVELEEGTLRMLRPPPATLPDWTQLAHRQCSNCPLDPAQHSHCPVAASMVDLVEAFKNCVSYEQVEIIVHFNDRESRKSTALQYGVSSLMGLFMVTTGCPVMDKLRPMAYTHLPFASIKETLYRIMSMYLMAQYHVEARGGTPDWKMEKLNELYEEVGIVNRAFFQRLGSITGSSDAVNNALVNLDCFAILTTIPTADEHMQDLGALFAAWQTETAASAKIEGLV